jgi:hypothetical protein
MFLNRLCALHLTLDHLEDMRVTVKLGFLIVNA